MLFAGKHRSVKKKVFSKVCICLHDYSWECVYFRGTCDGMRMVNMGIG